MYGESLNNRIVFLDAAAACRTDEPFRGQFDDDHHKRATILTLLLIDKVVFPIRLDAFGVLRSVKKLLNLWVTEPPGVRLGVAAQHEMYTMNLLHRDHIPREFSRKPRSFEEVDRWKATKCCLLLLFTGPVVLQRTLPKDLYLNFVTLHCAILVVVNEHL